MDPELTAWVESTIGGAITEYRRTTSGGSRTTYLVDIERDGVTLPIVVRVEGQGSFTGTELTLTREAEAYRALSRAGVLVPALLGVRSDGSAIILERLDGTDDLRSLEADERSCVMDHFITVLCDLHSLDTTSLDLPGYARPATAQQHAQLDIEMWQRLGAAVEDLDPLIAFAGAWLHSHAPVAVQRTCFVQGDTGPGNFLASQGRVTGLVDWEFAHLGDPVDDVAWVLMRSSGGLADPSEIIASYEKQSGLAVDPTSLAYYSLAVQYRCAITTSLAVAGGGARGWAPYLLVTQRYLAGIAAGLCRITETADAEPFEPASPASPRSALYDRLLDDVRAAVKSIEDIEVREATRNSQILVHLLRAADRYGAELDVAEHADAQATFGSSAQPSRADIETAGSMGDRNLLGYLLRRRRRQALLWRTLTDRPASRSSRSISVVT